MLDVCTLLYSIRDLLASGHLCNLQIYTLEPGPDLADKAIIKQLMS